MTVEISDANGAVVRTLKSPGRLGVNRLAWDLRHDVFRRPPGRPSFFEPRGPSVPPGAYSVTVKYREYEASGSVNVLPDPRFDIPQRERVAKYETEIHVGAMQEVLTDAIERIRETQSQIDDVLERARESGVETTAATGTDGSDGDDTGDLMRAGRDLKKTLTELEKAFWDAPGTTKGIVRRNHTYSQIQYVSRSLGSSFDAPTEAQKIYLRQAEAELDEALAKFNATFSGEVAQFRRQVETSGIAFLEPKPSLEVPQQ